MRWSIRKDSAAPTVDNLRASADALRAEVAELSAEAESIRDVLPQLITDPDYAAEAELRLRDIEVLLPSKRRSLDAIAAEVPKAERREALAGLETERQQLERVTVRLMAGLPDRYERAAAQFAGVLSEMGSNAEQWAQLEMRADGVFGVRLAGQGAEARLRADLKGVSGGPMGHGGWVSLHEDMTVKGWDGKVLFEGRDA